MNMSYFTPKACTQLSGFYNNFYSQFHSTLNTLSRMQIELQGTQNALTSAKSENESLKAIIQGLQDQLANVNKASDVSNTFRNERKEPVYAEGKLKKIQNDSKVITILSPFVKEEEGTRPENQSTETYDSSVGRNSAFPSPCLNLKLEFDRLESEEDEENLKKRVPIRRRNGFKPLKDDESDQSDSKSKLLKAQRSRAKHLWITYGRKIIEYGAQNSKGTMRDKIRECNKLISKKGYSEVFLLRSNDTEKDKDFKKKFGRLALDFLGSNIEDSFLSSNYRDELLAQKEKVQNWIKKQIREI